MGAAHCFGRLTSCFDVKIDSQTDYCLGHHWNQTTIIMEVSRVAFTEGQNRAIRWQEDDANFSQGLRKTFLHLQLKGQIINHQYQHWAFPRRLILVIKDKYCYKIDGKQTCCSTKAISSSWDTHSHNIRSYLLIQWCSEHSPYTPGFAQKLNFLFINMSKPPTGNYHRHVTAVTRASSLWPFNTLRPRRNRRHFADDIFKCIFLNENVLNSIKISLKFISRGPINNIPSLVQIMAWRRPGDKPLSETMMVSLLMHICVTRPQWVNNGALWGFNIFMFIINEYSVKIVLKVALSLSGLELFRHPLWLGYLCYVVSIALDVCVCVPTGINVPYLLGCTLEMGSWPGGPRCGQSAPCLVSGLCMTTMVWWNQMTWVSWTESWGKGGRVCNVYHMPGAPFTNMEWLWS